ncbi:trypsin [Austwickia chelonae]|uniref:Putative peptidase n=1 Tax=Austwickia chelonae NBRC 105200 TaxID=1184607 RepID=K6VRJ2_9MICO|nr:serine protease [Austwickia chelonae]GAB79384.1 putative peptidase [Austwickia chelonae NBRC 105200]SEW43668.1 trypsin [Austwickia chelonae]
MSTSRPIGRFLGMAAAVTMIGGTLASSTAFAAPPSGEADSSTLIIGGTPAKDGEFPFIVSLQTSGKPFCGGSLIDSTTVLTAAHCVNDETAESAKKMTLVIGRTVLSDKTQGVERKVRFTDDAPDIRLHPSYGQQSGFDAALIHLDKPVNDITPATLPEPGSTALYKPGSIATVVGWGTTRPSWPPKYPDRLLKVNVPIQSPAFCARAGGTDYNSETDFCAGVEGKDSCRGDSGGPIMRKVDGRLYQIGIVSWGRGCAQKDNPGFYTSTASELVREGLGF